MEQKLIDKINPLVERLRTLAPDLTTVLLFGSAAAGYADEASDCDLLILTAAPLEATRRKALQKAIEEEFADLNLDLIFSTEPTLQASLPYEPAHRFWLENARLLWGRRPAATEYPPLAREALLSHLNIIAAEISLGALEEAEADQARLGLEALEHLLHIKLALQNEYSYSTLRTTMAELIGEKLVATIRATPEQITSSAGEKLYNLLGGLHQELLEAVEALPENTVDRSWKEKWQSNKAAETIGVGGSIGR